MDEIIKRDQNHVPVLAAITNDASELIRMLRVDPATGRLLVSAVIAPGTPLLLQTDGVNNGDQTKLNLVEGSNITLVDDGNGNVTISSTGGGGISGDPTEVVYFDASGNPTSDALFTRVEATSISNLARQVSVDLIQGFEITDSLLGGLNFTGSYTNDSAAGTAAFAGVADLSGFMQSPTTAIMGAMDSSSNFQAITVAPNNVAGSYTNGTVDSTWNLSSSSVQMQYDNGAGNQAQIRLDASLSFIRYDDNTNDRRIGIDSTGLYWEYNGTKQRLPAAVAPSAGYVIASTPGGNSTWALASLLPVAGGNTGNIQYNAGSDLLGGTDNFTYDPATGVFATRRVSDAEVFALLDPSGLGAWRLGMDLSDGSAPYMKMDSATRTFSIYGAKYVDISPILFTGTGLDDITFVGTFNGSQPPNTYTATIDSVDSQIIEAPLTAGSGFQVGDTVECYQGGPGGTLLTTGTVISSGGYPTADSVIIDNGGGSAPTFMDYMVATAGAGAGSESTGAIWQNVSDTVRYEITNTSGTTIVNAYPCISYAFYAADGISVIAQAMTGHTLGDSWTQDFDFNYRNLAVFNGNNNTILFGSTTTGNRVSMDISDSADRGRISADNVILGRIGGSNANLQLSQTGTIIETDGSLSVTTTQGAGQNPGLNIDFSTGLYGIGRINGDGNGTFLTIDDATQLVRISNVPTYADDAAAITGGLVTGNLYKTTTSGITSLNIVP